MRVHNSHVRGARDGGSPLDSAPLPEIGRRGAARADAACDAVFEAAPPAADILLLDVPTAPPGGAARAATPPEVSGSVQQPACRYIPGGGGGGSVAGGLRQSRSKLRLAQAVGRRLPPARAPVDGPPSSG